MAITPRQKRIDLNASIVIIGSIVIILGGIAVAKYPLDKDDDNDGNGLFAPLPIGAPSGVMALWCAADILMHFIGSRNGIHRKTTLGVLCFCLLGIVVADILGLFLRAVSPDESGLNLSRYRGGDEFFWSCLALSIVQCCCHVALIGVTGFKSSRFMPANYMSSSDMRKMTARSAV